MKNYTYVFAFAAIVALIVLLPLERTIHSLGSEPIYRFYSGFVLSIIAATAYAVLVRLVRAARRKQALQSIDPNAWTRPFSILTIAVLFLFGLLVWYVSWEGKTGVWYGLGFLMGGALTEAGIGRVIKNDQNPPAATSHSVENE